MIWLQGGVSFAIWIAYGIIQSRRSQKIKEWVGAMPRTQRGCTGGLLYIVAICALLAALWNVLQSGGFTPSGLTPLAWIAVTIVGLLFVHLNTLATGMLVSLVAENVTTGASPASSNKATEDFDPS